MSSGEMYWLLLIALQFLINLSDKLLHFNHALRGKNNAMLLIGIPTHIYWTLKTRQLEFLSPQKDGFRV